MILSLKFNEQKIGLVGFLILVMLTVITGMSVYAVMQHQAESTLNKSLQVSLKNDKGLFASRIAQRQDDMQMIATRPFIRDNLSRLDQPQSSKDLKRVADSFVMQGLAGISFYDANGREVASAGRFLPSQAPHMPVDAIGSAFISRDKQFLFHASADITDSRQRRLGSVVIEADLKLPDQTLADIASIGQTGEFALCSPLQNEVQAMDCFLYSASGWKFQHLKRSMSGHALPMNYALEGRTGIIRARDYRGVKVVAAYAPMEEFDLGTVLKIDQSELYSPVTEQLKNISLLLAVLVMLGGFLQYWMMRPMARQLIASRLALKKENDKNLALLHNASDGIHIIDMNGNLIEASDSFCRMLGYARCEMIGMNLTQWDADLQLPSSEITSILQKQYERNERAQFERPHRRKDGSLFDVEVSSYPLMLNGKPVLFCSSRDITERRKKDTELQLSKQRHEELFKNMSSGVAVYQPTEDGNDFIFTGFNRSAERMNHARREDLIGRKLTEIFPGSQKMGLIDALRRVWQSGEAEHFPVSFYEDKRISGWWENYLYKIDSGEIVAIFDDVTQRMLLQQALQHERDFTEAILQAAGALILVIDQSGSIVRFNHAAEAFTGYRFDEIKNQPYFWKNLFPLEQRADIERMFASALSGNITPHYENVLVTKQQEERQIEWTNTLLLDDEGKMNFLIAVGIDITERRQSESLIRMQSNALDSSTNGVSIADATDPELPLLYVNPAFERITGYPASELLGKNCRFLHAGDRDQPELEEIRACLKEGRSGKATLRNYRKDGTLFWSRLNISPIFDKNGKLVQFLGIVNDVTEQKHANDHLRLISGVFDHADEGILITDQDGTILEANPASFRITGYSRDEMLGQNPRILHSGRQDRQFYEVMWQEVIMNGYWSGEVWNKRKNGEVYPERLTLSAVKDDEGQVMRFIALFSDISSIKSHQQQLERLAHHDALTGLPNRTLLNDRFEMALAQVRRSGAKLAVCFMDLDGFKPVNDNFGHETGDILLIEVSQRMLAISRSTDTLARLGGDEFVLIFTDISGKTECEHMLARVMDTISQPFHIGGHEIRISASIGVAFYPDNDTDGESLLRHADQAMYVAKQSGRGRFHFFDTAD